MRMVLHWVVGMGVAMATLCMISCSSAKTEAARVLLERSRVALEEGQYTQALAMADSARFVGGTDTETQRAVIDLKRQISLREAEAKMASLQEEIEAFAPRLEETMRQEDMQCSRLSDYDECPMYRSRWELSRLKAEGLHVAVDSLGSIRLETLVSHPTSLEHTAFRLSGWRASDGSIKTFSSSNVAYDGALNYRYQVDGIHWEQVRYPSDDGSRLVCFVDSLGRGEVTAQRLELLCAGKSVRTLRLSDEERKSLKQGFALSALLRERTSKLREQEKYTRRYLRLHAEEDQFRP